MLTFMTPSHYSIKILNEVSGTDRYTLDQEAKPGAKWTAHAFSCVSASSFYFLAATWSLREMWVNI